MRAGVGGIPVALLTASAVAGLYFFDPATAGFYPPCLFKTVLGMGCPGCGSLRAIHQVLHGNFAAAWALNPPVIVALPLVLASGVISSLRRQSNSSGE
ncbi:MAG: DUF2752 domain-containing protein [Acidithiobacillales bacterium]